MNTKMIIGGIIAGIAHFLLGWLVYGIVLMDYMKSPVSGVDRGDDMVLWSIAIGSLLMGFLLSYIFSKAGINTISAGLVTGAVIGFLLTASFDFMMHGTTYLAPKKMVMVDVPVSAVLTAVIGAVLAWYNSLGSKK